jgi:MoaA/NifB/PqqE/SkfB family radical SAM enzyme/glycosyltransferase involved in cell wall biosynthesis
LASVDRSRGPDEIEDKAVGVGGAVGVARRILSRDGLDTLILFVTSVCNLRCGFCCYADNLNRSADISFADIGKISRSIGPFRSLLISGGEPFMRNELFEIFSLFAEQNGVTAISVPANGWFGERIRKGCGEFLQSHPQVVLELSISVDGLEETHDRLRGRAGSFARLCRTLNELDDLRARYPKFRLGLNTVVTHDNVAELIDIIHYFRDRFNLDEHAFELVRDLSVDTASHESEERNQLVGRYLAAVSHSFDLYLGNRVAQPLSGLPDWLGRRIVRGFAQAMAEVKAQRVRGKLWPFPCTAGRRIFVIDGSGSLKACEHRSEVVDLRRFDFDVARAMADGETERERAAIARECCDCIHGCFVSNSLQFSAGALATRVLPKLASVRKRVNRRPTAACFLAHPPTTRSLAIARGLRQRGWEVHGPEAGPHPNRFIEFLWIFARNLYASCTVRADLAVGFKPQPNVAVPLAICRMRGMQTWIDVDDLDHAYLEGVMSRMMEWSARWSSRRFDRVTYHHPALRDVLIDDFGCSPVRITQIDQGVSVNEFEGACSSAEGSERRRKLGLESRPVAIFTAWLNRAAEAERILAAWRHVVDRVPNACLVIVGGGPLLKSLVQESQRLGLIEQTRFIGAVPHCEIPAYLGAADVGLVYWSPHRANLFRCSLKLREYLAAGLPVVATDVGELSRFSDFVYQSAPDVGDYGDTIHRVLSGDGDHRERRGATYLSENLDWDDVFADALPESG